VSNDHWNTPPEVLDPIRAFSAIALDPCPNASSIVGADRVCEDGLAENWNEAAGLVFVNPPYSDVTPWIRRAAGEAARGVEVAVLLPADTSTRWFHDDLVARDKHHADAILYYRRRIRFLGAKGSPKFPSLLAYFGRDAAAFRDHFSPHGWVVWLKRRARRGRK